jgi:4-amino-4-deoxy-L-arabinose transferase-like glycosyltransferase
MVFFMKVSAPYLVVASIATILLLPFWLQDGMFSDGVLYAAISKNMAIDLGSFWQPAYSCDANKAFYEQPPLVFWIASLFFRLMGDNLFTERIFCALNYVIACLLIAMIWKQSRNNKNDLSWLPIILYTITPLVFWTYRHNMLENTMLIFDLLAIFSFNAVKGLDKKNDVSLLLMGTFAIFLAVLSKSVVGLFPLGFFFLQFIILKNISFGTMVTRSLSSLLVLILFFILLFYCFPNAYQFFAQYIDIQLLRSIKGEREVSENGNHFILLRRLFLELIPMFIPVFLAWVSSSYAKNKIDFTANSRNIIFWIALGLSASIPMLISPKQHGYYLVPAFPYFAIAASLLIAPAIHHNMLFFTTKKWIQISASLLLLCLIVSFTFLNKVSRDKAILNDVHLLVQKYDKCTVLGLDKKYCELYGLHSYLLRYGQIEVDCENKNLPFFLSSKANDLSNEGYTEDTSLNLQFLRLWNKNK